MNVRCVPAAACVGRCDAADATRGRVVPAPAAMPHGDCRARALPPAGAAPVLLWRSSSAGAVGAVPLPDARACAALPPLGDGDVRPPPSLMWRCCRMCAAAA